MNFIRCLFLTFLLGLGIFSNAFGRDRHAIIFSTMAASQSENDELMGYVQSAEDLLKQSGFDDKKVMIFVDDGAKVKPGTQDSSKASVLKGLGDFAGRIQEDDELWVFLFGNANLNENGLSITTRGPRLNGKELSDALNKIPGKQVVLGLNRQSAPLLELLKHPRRVVVTAANSDGQVNPPLFTKYLLKLWKSKADQPLFDLLKQAGDETLAFYKQNKLVPAEESQAFDGVNSDAYPLKALEKGPLAKLSLSKISNPDPSASNPKDPASKMEPKDTPEPPLPKAAPVPEKPQNPKPTKPGPTPPETAASKKEEPQPANEASKELLSKAMAQETKYGEFSAYFLMDHQDLVVDSTGETTHTRKLVVHLIEDVAAESFANFNLKDNPPESELEVEAAEIIYPDATYFKVTPKITNTPEDRYTSLSFPGARAGCVLRLEYKLKGAVNLQKPWFSENFQLQREIPVASSKFVLRIPKTKKFGFKLYQSKIQPTSSETSHSKVFSYDFGEIPAFENLPFDPPMDESLVRIHVSSLQSWTEFSDWSKRIVQKSDVLDDATKALTKELTAEAKTDTEKLHALYDFLCNLRYETRPVGVRAYQPRFPAKVCTERYGDCKDKANALVAMARELGIPGFMALLNRTSYTDATFPAWQFNHAIAFFPKLTGYPNGLWVDATDGSTPFSSLPPGDVGRQALVLEKPEARFREVTMAKGSDNLIRQNLRLEIATNGSITGHVKYETTGLSDYHLRQSFKNLGPQQRKSRFQQLLDTSTSGLTAQMPTLLDVKDLSKDFFAEADIKGSTWKQVLHQLSPPTDMWEYISPETRDRPLLMNDGQAFILDQTIQVINPGIDLPPLNWKKESPLIKASVEYTKDAKGWTRKTIFQVSKARISTEDYASFRSDVIEWLTQLQHHQTFLK